MIFTCPECDAEYDVTTYQKPTGETDPTFCPFCKALAEPPDSANTP